jgi:hypothetical protein
MGAGVSAGSGGVKLTGLAATLRNKTESQLVEELLPIYQENPERVRVLFFLFAQARSATSRPSASLSTNRARNVVHTSCKSSRTNDLNVLAHHSLLQVAAAGALE